PLRPPLGDVGAVLLGRVDRLSLKLSPIFLRAIEIAGSPQTLPSRSRSSRRVASGCSRTSSASRWRSILRRGAGRGLARRRLAVIAASLLHAVGPGRADIENFGDLPGLHAAVVGGEDAVPEILRVSDAHPWLLPTRLCGTGSKLRR